MQCEEEQDVGVGDAGGYPQGVAMGRDTHPWSCGDGRRRNAGALRGRDTRAGGGGNTIAAQQMGRDTHTGADGRRCYTWPRGRMGADAGGDGCDA
jgi:hypothetical protein